MKPTIKIIDTYYREVVSGEVTTTGNQPLAGATVSAWNVDSEGAWSMAMRTVTDTEGGYRLYLDSGWDQGAESETYKIVVTADAYKPGCQIVEVETDQTYADTDFTLSPADMVTLSGTITGTAPRKKAPILRGAGGTGERQSADGGVRVQPGGLPGGLPRGNRLRSVQADGYSEGAAYDSSDGSFSYAYSIQAPAAGRRHAYRNRNERRAAKRRIQHTWMPAPPL